MKITYRDRYKNKDKQNPLIQAIITIIKEINIAEIDIISSKTTFIEIIKNQDVHIKRIIIHINIHRENSDHAPTVEYIDMIVNNIVIKHGNIMYELSLEDPQFIEKFKTIIKNELKTPQYWYIHDPHYRSI